jgi:hypothetical protein
MTIAITWLILLIIFARTLWNLLDFNFTKNDRTNAKTTKGNRSCK